MGALFRWAFPLGRKVYSAERGGAEDVQTIVPETSDSIGRGAANPLTHHSPPDWG